MRAAVPDRLRDMLTRLKWTGILDQLDMRPAARAATFQCQHRMGGLPFRRVCVCLLRHIRSRILADASQRSYAACSFAIACG
jgi:hypothetical protein